MRGTLRTRLFRNGSFFATNVWTWQMYGYATTPIGVFKGGQIWKRFGLDWDNTWWGNPQYFFGFKLDTDWGFSWEQTWPVTEQFAVESFVQYFMSEDRVNGSLVGGDAESVIGLSEKNTGVVRVVPTWQINDDMSLALGLSGQFGGFENSATFGTDPVQTAWATDLTFEWGDFMMFGEVMQAYGSNNPSRFTSGGPSNVLTAILGGVAYQTGPVQWRANASRPVGMPTRAAAPRTLSDSLPGRRLAGKNPRSGSTLPARRSPGSNLPKIIGLHVVRVSVGVPSPVEHVGDERAFALRVAEANQFKIVAGSRRFE